LSGTILSVVWLVGLTVRRGIVLGARFVESAETLMLAVMWGDEVRCIAAGRVPLLREFMLLSRS
jgi:hypothetical protein